MPTSGSYRHISAIPFIFFLLCSIIISTSLNGQCEEYSIGVWDHDNRPFEPRVSSNIAYDGHYFVTHSTDLEDILFYLAPGEEPVIIYDVNDISWLESDLELITVLGNRVLFRSSYNGGRYYLGDGPSATREFLGGLSGSIMEHQGKRVFNDSIVLFEDNSIEAVTASGDVTTLIDDELRWGNVNYLPPNMEGPALLPVYGGFYVTDGTPAGTFEVLDTSPGFQGDGSRVVYRGDQIYFTLNGGLYRTDGSNQPAQLISDNPGWPEGISSVHNLEHGLAITTFNATEGSQVWVSDGTVESIEQLTDLAPDGIINSAQSGFRVAGGRLFMANVPESEDDPADLWTSDGSVDGTFLLQSDASPSFPNENNRPSMNWLVSDGQHVFLRTFDEDATNSVNLYYFHPDNPNNGTPLATEFNNPQTQSTDPLVIGEWLYANYCLDENRFLRLNGLTGATEVISPEFQFNKLVFKDEDNLVFQIRTNGGTELNADLIRYDLNVTGGNPQRILNDRVNNLQLRSGYIDNDDNYRFLYRSPEDQLTEGSYQPSSGEIDTTDLLQKTLGEAETLTIIDHYQDWILFKDLDDSIHLARLGEEHTTNIGLSIEDVSFLGGIDQYLFLFDNAPDETYLIDLSSRSATLFDMGQATDRVFLSVAARSGNRLYFKRNWRTGPLGNQTVYWDIAYWEAGQEEMISILNFEGPYFDVATGSLDIVAIEDSLYFPWSTDGLTEQIWSIVGDVPQVFLEPQTGNGNHFIRELKASASAFTFDFYNGGVDSSYLLIEGTSEPINLGLFENNTVTDIKELAAYYLLVTQYGLYSFPKNGDGSLVTLAEQPSYFGNTNYIPSLEIVNDSTAAFNFIPDGLSEWQVWVTDGQTAEFIEDTGLGLSDARSPSVASLNGNQLYYFYEESFNDYQLRSYDLSTQVISDAFDEVIYPEADSYPFSLSGQIVYFAEHPDLRNELHYLSCFRERTPLTVSLYYDENGNGERDANERGVPFQTLRLTGPEERLLFSDNNGLVTYSLLQDADYILELFGSTCWSILDPGNTIIDLEVATDPISLEIGMELPGNGNASTEALLVSGPTRCGFTVPFWLNVNNTGCTIDTVYTDLVLPEEVYLVSAGLPFEYNEMENTYRWSLGELLPSEFRRIDLELQMPDETFVGQAIELTAISGIPGFVADTFSYSTIITCAIDPNDKQVLPARPEPSMSNYTQFDEELTYTIRFQNTGNDTAFTVRIEDQLSPDLDWNSVRPVAASHPYNMQLDESGLLTFLFEDILLPDSSTNLIGSQGFVTIKVAMLAGIPDFAAIENTSGIFFDFNAPIITNTVTTTAVEFLDFDQDGYFFWDDCDDLDTLINPGAVEIPANSIDEDCDGLDDPSNTNDPIAPSIVVFPNPTRNFTTVNLDSSWQPLIPYRISGPSGSIYLKGNVISAAATFDLGELPAGLYYLRLYHETRGKWITGKILVQ